MKKIINNMLMAIMIISGMIFIGCQNSEDKLDKAQANAIEANKDLKEAVKDANTEAIKIADNTQWILFRDQTELKIKNNQSEISALKTKVKSSAKSVDAMYNKQIDELEQKNKAMKERMDNYEKQQSDWELFKTEFNHDMDALGLALKNLAVDNKK